MNGPNETNKQPDRARRPGDTQRRDRSDEARIIHYLVNGERQRTEREALTAEEILRHAGASAGIDVNDLDDYYLECVADDRRYRNLADEVRLKDGDQFLAVYSGRTPVA